MAGRHKSSKNQQRDDSAEDDLVGLGELEIDLDAREEIVKAREAAQDARENRERDIVAAAEARDEEADARDREAQKRDEADPPSSTHARAYGMNVQAQRSAALDRLAAKSDRISASRDRSKLTADVKRRPSNPPGE